MTIANDLIAQALVHILTLIALLIAYRTAAPMAQRSAVVARLRLLYWLLATLMLLRTIFLFWPAAIISTLLMISAAWSVFATLRLAEELLRRHAHRPIKLLVFGGACAFTILALTVGLVWDRAVALALAGWQLLSIMAIIATLAQNRRGTNLTERQAANMLILAFICAMPLILTDFRTLFPNLSVRGGDFALLMLLFATSRLAMARGTPAMLLADMVIVSVAGAILWGMSLLIMPGLNIATRWPLIACATALMALMILFERFWAIGRERTTIVAALAQSPANASKIDLLSAHPLLNDGHLLGAEELTDYPPSVVAMLARSRLISADDLDDMTDDMAADAAIDLMTRYAATHLIRMSADPPQFLAIAAGAMAGPALDDELQLMARLVENAR